MAPNDRILQKGHSLYQKYKLTKMALNINDISQKCHLTKMVSHNLILGIGFVKYYQTPANRTYLSLIRCMRVISILLCSGKHSILKSHEHESESYKKFKKFLLKIIQLSPSQITFGYFFIRRVIFVMHHFLWVSYFFI